MVLDGEKWNWDSRNSEKPRFPPWNPNCENLHIYIATWHQTYVFAHQHNKEPFFLYACLKHVWQETPTTNLPQHQSGPCRWTYFNEISSIHCVTRNPHNQPTPASKRSLPLNVPVTKCLLSIVWQETPTTYLPKHQRGPCHWTYP